MTMLRLTLFLHIPSIRKGAEDAFFPLHMPEPKPHSSHWQINPWKAAQYFRDVAESQHKERVSIDSIFIYSDLGRAGTYKTQDLREQVHKVWCREIKEEGVKCHIETGGKNGKGLEVKLALDFADLAWEPSGGEPSNDKYIAVMFAMDREVAPAAERICLEYGGHGIEVAVAMWSSSEGERRNLLCPDCHDNEDVSLRYDQMFLAENVLSEMRDERDHRRWQKREKKASPATV